MKAKWTHLSLVALLALASCRNGQEGDDVEADDEAPAAGPRRVAPSTGPAAPAARPAPKPATKPAAEPVTRPTKPPAPRRTTQPATQAATKPAQAKLSLQEAAEKGDLEQLKRCIAPKADLNARDSAGKTALMYAAEMHQFEAAKLLVDAGADVHLVSTGTIHGFNAVHYAAGHGDNRIIELLLKAGAKVDVKGMWNATALHQAAFNGHEQTVLLLLSKGADPLAVKEDGSTPLHDLARASSVNLAGIAALLKAKVKVDAVDNQGRTALHLAASQGHAPVVKLLLDSGANVNAKDQKGKTALYYATRRRQQAAVDVLKAHGATL